MSNLKAGCQGFFSHHWRDNEASNGNGNPEMYDKIHEWQEGD